MKLELLVKNPRIFLILALALMPLILASKAKAEAPSCAALFSGETQLAALRMLNTESEQLHNLMLTELNHTPENFARAVSMAEQIFAASGTKTKQIQYQDMIALEIVADEKAQLGWNKMAASLSKNYGARLIYSPSELIHGESTASFVAADKVILISRESLREGRAERNVLHEIGHMKTESVKEKNPTIFNGYIEVADFETRQNIVNGSIYYKESMEIDELPRAAQDFDRLARDLRRATTGEEQTRIRAELKATAARAKEILANTTASLEFMKAFTVEVTKSKHGSGPVMLADGTAGATMASIFAGQLSQVIVERKETGAVRLKLEGTDLTAEMWVRGDASWIPIIQSIKFNDKRVLPAFKAKLTSLVTEREGALAPSLAALSAAAQALIESTPETPQAELVEIALKPRRVLAPHLAKPKLPQI